MTTQTFKYFIENPVRIFSLTYCTKSSTELGGAILTSRFLFQLQQQTQRTEKARKEKSIKPFITNIEQIYVTKIFSSWLL